MRLTQKAVDGIGLDTDRVVWDDDAPGLGLRVQSGRRSWIVRYRVAGASRQKSLPATLPLKLARVRAAEIRTGAAGGVDVVETGRAAAVKARKQADDAKARSLGAIVEVYLVDAEKRLRLASVRLARMYLRGQWHALHDRPADELTRREIVAVLQPYAGRRTAIQLLRHLSACLSWGMERGLLDRHAAIGIKPPAEAATRDRVLTAPELRTILAAADAAPDDGFRGGFGDVVKLLLLTAQRRGEVGGMAWSEIDLENAQWSLPADRCKNARPHTVPLPRQAVEILRRHYAPGRVHVFGAKDTGVLVWQDCRDGFAKPLGLPHWTLHDLRRTAVTGMAELGIQPHVIEAIVNHQSGHKAGVAGVYNRAQYSQEKRAALQRWADHVERIVAGEAAENVVAFGR